MTTCCFMTLMTVLAVIGIICIIAILAMAFVIHSDLKDILRIKNDCYK